MIPAPDLLGQVYVLLLSADPTCCVTQSQCTDARPASPSADSVTHGLNILLPFHWGKVGANTDLPHWRRPPYPWTVQGVLFSEPSAGGWKKMLRGRRRGSSSCAFPSISLGFISLLLLVRSHLYLWASPVFFFFCVPSYICGALPVFFFFCVPSCISGLHQSSSSSAFPAISVGFTSLLLLLRSQLYLWASPVFFFFCVPSYICGLYQSSSSSAFPAVSLGFTSLLLLLLLLLS